MAQHPETRDTNLRRLAGTLGPYVWTIVAGVALTFVLSALNLCLPLGSKIAIDHAFPSDTNPTGDKSVLVFVLCGFVGVYFLRNVAYFFSRFYIARVAERTGANLKRRLCERLHIVSLEVIKRLNPGNVLSRATADVAAVQELIQKGILSAAVNVFTFIGTIIVMFWLMPFLAAVSLLVLPFHAYAYMRFRRWVADAAKRSKATTASVSARLLELLVSPELVKSSGAEKRESADFGARLEESLHINMRLQSLYLWQKVAADLLAGVGTIVVFGYAGWLVIGGKLTAGAYVAFYSYVVMLYVLVAKIAAQSGHLAATMPSVERIFEILELAPGVTEAEEAVSLKRIVGDVELRDVTFEYDGTNQGVRRVSFHAKAGETVALIGPSGAGKSTLAKLLARLYDPQSGQILVDGVDMAHLKVGPFRDQVAIVFQETVLFAGTVLENIRYARPDATDEKVVQAAKQAEAHAFIEQLPRKYGTMIGPGGQDLSMGQKQRIGIARAILKDPAILILDEATSAVDVPTRREIAKTITRLFKDRTRFVITHDYGAVRHADVVVALDNGQVRQAGSAEDVVAEHTELGDTLGGQMLL